MKKAGYTDNGGIAWIETEDPADLGRYAVVEPTVVPICTEYRYHYDGVRMGRIGHEAVGRVVSVPNGSDLSAGTRVVVMPTWPCGTCPYCKAGFYVHCIRPDYPWEADDYTSGADTFAEQLIKPDWLLVPIPGDLSDEMASMTLCGLGPTFGAMQTLDVGTDSTVLIMGLGPVGLGGVVNAIDRGARVVAIEPNPYRRELGEALGAEVIASTDDDVVAYIRQETDDLGPDVVLECTGIEAARKVAIRSVRSMGSVAFVGEGGDLTTHVSDELIRTGKRLLGSWHYNLYDTPQLFDVMRRNPDLVESMITHRFPLENFVEAWNTQKTGRTGKVLLTR